MNTLEFKLNNMNHDSKIDQIFKKIDNMSFVSSFWEKRSQRVLENHNDEIGLKFDFSKKDLLDEEIFAVSEMYKIEGSFKKLISLLDLNIKFQRKNWSNRLGQYQFSNDILIKKGLGDKLCFTTLIHEVAHAIDFTFKIDSRKYFKLMSNLFSELEGKEVEIKSFSSALYYCKDYISWYSGKDINEAFAEIFASAYTPWQSNKVKKACQNFIDSYYTLVLLKFNKDKGFSQRGKDYSLKDIKLILERNA